MNRALLLLRALVGRKWRWVTLFVLLLMAGLARLGIWQLDRLAQRLASNAQLLTVLNSAPIDLNTAVLPDDVAAWKDREVIVQGTFDFEWQGILLLQTWQGRPGAHLVAPLVLADGQTAVLIDRGWIPDAETAVANYTQYNQPGPISIAGFMALSQTLSRAGAPASPSSRREWYRLDIAQLQQQMPYQLLPIYIIQTPSPAGEQLPPFHPPRELDLTEGPHLSYAIQWFIFSLGLGIGYLVYVFKTLTQAAPLLSD